MSLVLVAQPAIGLALGAVAALAARAAAAVAPALAGPAGVLVLEAGNGLRGRRALARRGPGGAAAALALLVLKLAAAARVPEPALATALVLAAMLGRWAIVVLSYGGVQRPGDAGGAPPARAGFAEFGWASLLAFAVTLSVAEAIGLLLLLAAATVTLAARVWMHRRAGGVTPIHMHAAAELVETTTLATLALLSAIR